MFRTNDQRYLLNPFTKEADLERAIFKVQDDLFGFDRIYLDCKKKIGPKNGKRNIPDGYLIDLSSARTPVLYVVENELAAHDLLRHIAVQILEFSLSYERSPSRVKAVVKEALSQNEEKWAQCADYAAKNGFENVDYLLERMIFDHDSFRALVIIDECVEELETVLIRKFQFPVEILTLQRYRNGNEEGYFFEPFLADVEADIAGASHSPLDPAEIDTVVVPAHEEGFQETFLDENRWYAIRLHASMIPKLRHIAAYRVKPTSAITHLASIERIEPWQNSGKYVVYFSAPAQKVSTVPLVKGGRVKAPQSLRYTSLARLQKAQNLDEVF